MITRYDAGGHGEHKSKLPRIFIRGPRVGRTRPAGRSLAAVLVGLLISFQGRAAEPAGGFPARPDPAFTAFFQQTNHWAAGDVASSIPLSDGRVLWLFGDSYVDQLDPATGMLPCLFSARNAVLVQNTNDFQHPRTLYEPAASDQSFFRPPVPGRPDFWPCFWPGIGFQSGRTIYVYLTLIQKTPAGGMWGFQAIGQYWARMSFPELKVTGYSELPSFAGIYFWCGFVPEASGRYMYAYGARQHAMGSDVFLARFLIRNPEGPWEFWDKTNWSRNVTNAAAIAQGASISVDVCKVRNRFLLVSTEFSVACDQGRKIYVATADQPAGPFTPRKVIYTIPDAVHGHRPFFYSAMLHPEFLSDAGMLITYCVNGYEPCLPTCVQGRMNPDYYRPRAIRLPLGSR